MIKRYLLILNVFLVIGALAILSDISFSLARAGKVTLPKPPSLLPVKEEVEKEPKPYDYYAIISERNFFAGKLAGVTIGEGLPEALPDLKLKGTIVVEGLDSLCIIQDIATQKEEVYKKGDLVGGNEIVQIKRDHIVLKTPTGLASLIVYGGISLPGLSSQVSGLVRQVASNKWSLSRSEFTSVISNPSQLLAQVKVTPYLEAGQMRGFRLDNIQKGSLTERLGARSGDIVRKVEGQELDSIERTIQIYQEVKDRPSINVEVERGGRPITLTYEIRD